jgi:hypothetical protein
MDDKRRGSLSLFVVLLAVALGFVAISGGGFLAFRFWRQPPAIDADLNVRQGDPFHEEAEGPIRTSDQ